MRPMIITVAVALAMMNTAGAARPFEDLLDYEEPRLPVGGDCDALEACEASQFWRGEFSGKRFDTFNDQYYPFAISGCFDSALACRIWQQRAITYSVDGPIYYMRCRPGSPE